jgi:pimeloyl-ACP methyl ester carboxylesterase
MQKKFLQRSKTMLLWLIAIFIVLAVSGSIYQAIITTQDKQNYPPPGQMVTVGDRRLHLRVTGEVIEYPTVILEAGMASFSSNWYWVQTELSAITRVVSYDRAGLGWSDPAPEVFDAYKSARDLHTALANAGIAAPYVVAGHSYGGLVVRAFTDLYPDEVVGMVLVDGSHPDQWAHMPASRNGRVNATTTKITSWLARFGVVRLFDLSASVIAGLPEQPTAEMRAILNQPQSWATGAATLAIWPERTTPLIHQAHSLGDLPLSVLGVTEQPFYSEVLTSLQAELPALSTNSIRTVVEGATHENLIAKRENALIVVTAVHQVLESAQTSQPLADISLLPLTAVNQ